MEHDTSRLDSTRDHGTRELGLSPSVPPSMPSPMPNPMPSQAAAMQVGLSELPPVTTTRWVTRRKAAVVAAVREGVLTLDEACRRYHLSVEEFTSWQRLSTVTACPACAPPASKSIASPAAATERARARVRPNWAIPAGHPAIFSRS